MQVSRNLVFRIFKYSVFTLLLSNVVLFFLEENAAATTIYGEAMSLGNFLSAYSATVDTAAWLVLLLLFEFETAIIDRSRLRGRLKWSLPVIRGLSYLFIVSAFYGYCARYQVLAHAVAFTDQACAFAQGGYAFLESLDVYPPLTMENCQALTNEAPLVRLEKTLVIASAATHGEALRLAFVDVINAADWLLVVVILEIEVILKLSGRMSRLVTHSMNVAKALLYAVLFACALYWGIAFAFLDFWDAFLWLVAFIFIELNILSWDDKEPQSSPA